LPRDVRLGLGDVPIGLSKVLARSRNSSMRRFSWKFLFGGACPVGGQPEQVRSHLGIALTFG
jgi:hypothetical protein